jgi:glycosyltransferase involved in cell wall biosynthesis
MSINDTLSGIDTSGVSVVIPTLGGESLFKTVDYLNEGSMIPDEILVCIPDDQFYRAESLSHENVRVIKTTFYGQVAQRATGFQQAKNPWVLQLDDDILLAKDCLENLLVYAKTHDNSSVGPKLFDKETSQYHSYMIPDKKQYLYKKMLFLVINGMQGYVPGKISKAGINMGIPLGTEDCNNIEWLPGGCILHRKDNLILYNYYPFKGKAFAEDLYYSALIRQRGVNLCRCGNASCYVDFSHDINTSMVNYVRSYLKNRVALLEFVRRTDKSVFRLNVFLVLNVLQLFMKYLFKSRYN